MEVYITVNTNSKQQQNTVNNNTNIINNGVHNNISHTTHVVVTLGGYLMMAVSSFIVGKTGVGVGIVVWNVLS